MSSIQAGDGPAPVPDRTVTIEIPTGHEPSPDVATAEAQADRARFGYQPALDGLRAVAVLGVLFYHGLVSWWRGGFLGVDVFFTLSGYLITTLLLMERDATSRIDLKGFWIRRARRLLPALFLVTAFVAAYGAFFAEPLELSSLRADSIASLFYVANWRFIFSGQSYFSALLAPSPVKHTWSLAIEEQWYLFWPIVFTLGYKFTKFRARNWAIGLLGFAALSGLLMAVLYHPGSDPSRVYYGTDTRAQPLLLGAALAFALQGRDLRRWPAWLLQSLGAIGMLSVLVMFVLVDDRQSWMYRGGFTVIALATCALIVGVMAGRSTVARSALALPPLPLIGRMSYGLYLWHWPIFVFLSANRTGLDGYALLGARLAVTAVVATLSYNLIEMPVRKGALRRLAARLAPRNPAWVVLGATAITAVLLTGILVAVTATPSRANDRAIQPGDLKTFVVGDSVMFTLQEWVTRKAAPGLAVRNGAVQGCGITRAASKGSTREITLPKKCLTRLDDWKGAIDSLQPDVSVISTSAWELYDLVAPNGTTLRFGTPQFDKYVQSELDTDRKVLTARGGQLVVLTMPCTEVVHTDGSPVDPERLDESRRGHLNQLAVAWAKKYPQKVTVIDLRSYLCPKDQYKDSLNGVPLYLDGEHYSTDGAAEVWKWLSGQIHQATSAK